MKIALNAIREAKYRCLKLVRGKRAGRAYRSWVRNSEPIRSECLDYLGSLREGPVIVVGFMSSSIGLGVTARKLVGALRSVQIEPLIHDLSAAFDLPQIHFDWCQAVQQWPEGGTVVVCLNPPDIQKAVQILPSAILDGRWLIGYFWWELERVPLEWRPIIKQFDEIWVSTAFVYSAFSEMRADFELSMLPVRVDVDAVELKRKTDGEFVVLAASDLQSWPQRKNPLGAAQAFIKAFDGEQNARLILKVQNAANLTEKFPEIGRLVARHSNIELIAETYGDEEFRRLLERVDVILSLHRSEGLGLIPIEGMALGKVVVATNWGGACDYLDASCAVPIGYSLRKVAEEEYISVPPGSRWAEPDLDEAAKWLRILRNDPELCVRLGARARLKIGLQYGADSKSHVMEALVCRPRHSKGRRVSAISTNRTD